jgi:small-conductance mechanosensitive channel
VGNSVLDAAIAAGVRPRTEAPAEPGMRVAKERSFYLWATLEHRWLFPDRIVYQRLTTDESARIDEQVMPFQFSAERTRAYMDARRITLLEGIAAHATRQAIGADAKKQIDQKIATYVNRSDTLGRSASALDKMRNEERRLTNTLQQVERFQNILTMSSLRVQANAQEELRKEVAKAKSAADLINVLKAGHAAALAKIQTAEPAVNALAAQQDKAYGEFFDVLPVPPDQRERLRELL